MADYKINHSNQPQAGLLSYKSSSIMATAGKENFHAADAKSDCCEEEKKQPVFFQGAHLNLKGDKRLQAV